MDILCGLIGLLLGARLVLLCSLELGEQPINEDLLAVGALLSLLLGEGLRPGELLLGDDDVVQLVIVVVVSQELLRVLEVAEVGLGVELLPQ